MKPQLEIYKTFAFEALTNKHAPFAEGGAVGDIHCLDDAELLRFAEMIVTKCAELGDIALQNGEWPADVIREHFGITNGI